MAKAIGDIISNGVDISLVDINKSEFSFIPDAENNVILFGMKALSNVGKPIIEKIIKGRPYVSLQDFMIRCPLNKIAMISLIKSGAFDKLVEDLGKELNKHPRQVAMVMYLKEACKPKKRITMQNFNGLIQNNLLPEDLQFQIKVYNFNKFLKANCKSGENYILNYQECLTFYENNFNQDLLSLESGVPSILQTNWDKICKKEMEIAKIWIAAHHDEVLENYNSLLFKQEWEKYANASCSAYEMESLGFYYGEHELANVDVDKYGIVDFFDLDSEGDVDYFIKRNGGEFPIYRIDKIIGTVIAKDDNRSTVSLLTTSGVVTVKFSKEYYSMYKRQLSETQEDGTKKITEKGWFKRGVKLLVGGHRRGDTFVGKTYSKTPFHQIYKITQLNEDGSIELIHDRSNSEEE